MLDGGKQVQIIDARPKHYFSRTQDIMDGAVWRDPIVCRTGSVNCRNRIRSSFFVLMDSMSDAEPPLR